jgi:O-antigen ligase
MLSLPVQSRWPADWGKFALFIGALTLGLAVGVLPLPWAVGLVVVGLAAVLALSDPLWALGFALLLGPTKPYTDVYLVQLPLDLGQLALIGAFGVWALHRMHKRAIIVPRTPLTPLLGGFIFVGLLSLVDTLSLGAGLTEVLKWVQMLVIVWVVTVELHERPHQRGFVIGLVLAAAAAQALIGVWQFGIRGDGPEFFAILGGDYYRAYGTFEQPNPFGGFLAMASALTIGLALGAFEEWAAPLFKGRTLRGALNKRLWHLLGLGLLLALLVGALVMSWSRGSWLGFAVGVAGILVVWPRKTWVGVGLAAGGALSAGGALYFNLLPASVEARLTGFLADFTTLDVRGVDINDINYSILERVAHWQAAWEMARYNPILGVGLGNYEVAYSDFALINWPNALGHAHNIYLNMLAEVGVVGLCYYLVMWAAVLWLTWRVTRHKDVWIRSIAIGLFGVWVHLCAHSFLDKLYVANLHLHLGVMLGLLSALWTANLEKTTHGKPHNN